MAYPQKAGKTAPRLAEDLRLYDPVHPPGTGRNLLSEVPPVFPKFYDGPRDYVSPAACQHNYVTKTNQTYLAQEEQKQRPGASSKVSAICTKCRYHLQVVVNHGGGGNAFARRNLEDHIHHLVYKSGRQQGGTSMVEVSEQGQVAETFHYQCSHLSCSAMVSLRILSPLINPNFERTLTDSEMIRQRAEAAIAAEPERLEGMAKPLPINVLDNLRLYLNNALHNKQFSKSIAPNNKRFMISFGVEGAPCKELLEFLGFEYREVCAIKPSTRLEPFPVDVDVQASWQPPRPDPKSETPYHDAFRIFLDDAIHEMHSLIDQRPASEKKGLQTLPLPPPPSNSILQALEALDYLKSPRAKEFAMPDAEYYEDLGTVEDMATPLIVEAYERQTSIDPSQASHYLQCLKVIGTLRGGEDSMIIEQAVQVAYAEGKYTEDDEIAAYRYFGLCQDDPNNTEDIIIGKYYAYLSSVQNDEQVLEAARQLWRIGDSRGSKRITAVSEERVSTVEQAFAFLGVDEKTPDDFIITMYTAKLNDNPSCRDIARKAVEFIANSRQSLALKHFLDTGETVEGEMDVGDAYRLLQIPDRTADADAVIAAYTICVDENPKQADVYNRALSIIAKETDNSELKTMAGISTEPERDRADWPVGLQNIGNTCYLNSLLQFYFSIRPFREMVLDIERYQMDLDDEKGMAQKQVGSRKVAKKEVERSLRFLGELRDLFNSMITSSQPSVNPGQELARLTLISPGGEDAIRRRSTVSKTQSLGEINGAPIFGPLGPPQAIVEEQSEQKAASDTGTPETVKDPNVSDAESEATLVSKGDGSGPSQEKEDQAQHETESTASKDLSPRPDPPNRPPPVPPRLTPEVDRRKRLIEEVEIGAQQDVTEVINNVLFQSQCAIKPRDIANDGEQVDQIKDLFYGQTRSYISTSKGTRSKDERWCDIKVDVASGSRDIYSAIDGAFDVQKISVENAEAEQFGSITKIPPILQIQVQRVQFDAVKKSSFKSTHHLDLSEVIYMDRYMDTQKPEVMDKRRQCWQWKSTLKSLEARKAELLRKQENDGLDMPQLFRQAKNVLEDMAWIPDEKIAVATDSQLLSDLDQLSHVAETELQDIEGDIESTKKIIGSQFSEYQKLPYRLYAVFMHHGSVSFGHYWIYIYDFRNGIWRKYNDEYVTEVQNLDEIFKDNQPSNPPTPYFLVYINEQMKDRLVDPVCRDIVQAMPDAPASASAEASADAPIPMEDVQITNTPEAVNNDALPTYDETLPPSSGHTGKNEAPQVATDEKGRMSW